MPVLINCSWCGKTMGSMPINKIRDWTEGEVCKSCLAKKAATEAAFNGVIDKIKGKADMLMREAEPMIKDAIAKIAQED